MDALTPIGGNVPATTTTTAAPAGEVPDNSSLDKDAFLTLLVAQLKYQDPTAPTDVSQMMSQTSQLSMVERLDQIAEGIKSLGGGGPLSSAAGMLGRQVTFDTGAASPITATVDAVRMVDGQTVLTAGGYEVPLDALIEVRSQPAAAPAPVPAPAATPAPTPDAAVHDHAHDHDHGDTGADPVDATDNVAAADVPADGATETAAPPTLLAAV